MTEKKTKVAVEKKTATDSDIEKSANFTYHHEVSELDNCCGMRVIGDFLYDDRFKEQIRGCKISLSKKRMQACDERIEKEIKNKMKSTIIKYLCEGINNDQIWDDKKDEYVSGTPRIYPAIGTLLSKEQSVAVSLIRELSKEIKDGEIVIRETISASTGSELTVVVFIPKTN